MKYLAKLGEYLAISHSTVSNQYSELSPPAKKGLNFNAPPHPGQLLSNPGSSQASCGNLKHGESSGLTLLLFNMLFIVNMSTLSTEKR